MRTFRSQVQRRLKQVFARAQEDFEDTSGVFEFIYHENHELLLTLYEDNCYFSPMTRHVTTGTWPHQTMQVMFQINEHDGISRSSLQHVRNEFEDRLADYHCLDKHVWELHIDFGEAEHIIG
nr:hypothetical protein BaRGS_012348 [Batillaria attramentaria]